MNGIAILGSLPGSPAEENGLRYGDFLLSVNGFPMTSVEDFLQARSAADGKMRLLVRRGIHVMDVTLDVARSKKAKKTSAAMAMEKMRRLSLVPPPAEDGGSFN